MAAGNEIPSMIFDAIGQEVREREFYLALAKRVKNPLVRRKINGIADDELEHRQTLSRLYWAQTGKEPGMVDPEPAAVAWPDMDRKSLRELFQEAMEMEKAAAGKYSRMALEADKERTSAFLEYLADFERGHYETLSAEFLKLQRSPGWEDYGPAD